MPASTSNDVIHDMHVCDVLISYNAVYGCIRQAMPQSPESSVSSVLIEWHRKRRRGTALELGAPKGALRVHGAL